LTKVSQSILRTFKILSIKFVLCSFSPKNVKTKIMICWYLCHFGRFEDRVTSAEVRVRHPVGKASHANPDALENSVAGQLMKNETGINLKKQKHLKFI
jgi:hypothetical protein